MPLGPKARREVTDALRDPTHGRARNQPAAGRPRCGLARVDAPAVARLLNALATTLLALVGLAGLLVCARRLGGALTEPLSPGVLVALGAGLALTAALFRLATFAELSRRATFLPRSAGPRRRWCWPCGAPALRPGSR